MKSFLKGFIYGCKTIVLCCLTPICILIRLSWWCQEVLQEGIDDLQDF